MNVQRTRLVVGIELIVTASELIVVGPANVGGVDAPRIVRIDRQQGVVQVKQGQFHSLSNINLIKGIVIAR